MKIRSAVPPERLSHIFCGQKKNKNKNKKKQKKSAKHIRIRLLPEVGCVNQSINTRICIAQNKQSDVI